MPHAPLALTLPSAALLMLLAVPSALAAYRGWEGTLDRKGRLGLHTPAALGSEKAFALANRVAAPLVASAAGVGAVCAVLVVALPMGVAGAVVVAALGLIGLLVQLYLASVLGERAARTVPRPARKPEAGEGCCGGCGCGDGGCQAGAGAEAGAGADGSTAGAR